VIPVESVVWFVSLTAIVLWLVLGIEFLVRPPTLPRGWTASFRRLGWGVVWVSALLAGTWGPELWARSSTDFPRDPDAGAPVERITRTLRAPFVVQATTREMDSEARLVRAERRLSLQLPVGFIAFLGLGLWLRPGRSGGPTGTGRHHGAGGSVAVALAILACGGAVACGQFSPDGHDRPERVVTEVRWDTVAHLRVSAEDTVLFSADQVVAKEDGFWVLDRTGYRVARFDWSGSVRWYAGRQGAGPGELMNPRVVDVDDRGVAWVMDVGTARITGFNPEGAMEREISLRDLGGMMGAFAVSREGDRFFGVVHEEDVIPVVVDGGGRVRRGEPLFLPEEEDIWGFALQGMAAREPAGDRWVYAFAMGDGLFRMDEVSLKGERIPYPERVPFPRMVEEVTTEANRTITTRRLTEPNFSARSVAVARGRILVQFMGETEDRGRILDLYDLDSGAYERSVLLPRNGHMGAWEDRIVLAMNDPTPEVLVLRMVD
jgi:hypothetical protein